MCSGHAHVCFRPKADVGFDYFETICLDVGGAALGAAGEIENVI